MKHEEYVKWLERANEQTPETLPAFVTEVVSAAYECRNNFDAVPIVALATFAAYSDNPTTEKARFHTSYLYSDSPVERIFMSNMLYPQYRSVFMRNVLTTDLWEWIQSEAARLYSTSIGSKEVREHWLSIINGNVPFGYTVE